jgi:hypothetical protein
MKIVEYIAAFSGTVREPAREDFATVARLLSLPWVVAHKIRAKDSFVRFSLAYGNTLMMEYQERGIPSFKVVGHIFDPDPKLLDELPAWQIPEKGAGA